MITGWKIDVTLHIRDELYGAANVLWDRIDDLSTYWDPAKIDEMKASVRVVPAGEAAVAAACEALLARGTKPTVPEVAPLVQAYYAMPENGAGGSLHIVLDDQNIGDSCVRYCAEAAEQQNDVAGAALAKVLLMMSKTQRLKLATMPVKHAGEAPLGYEVPNA